MLCSGSDVSVALISGDRAVRGQVWQRGLEMRATITL
jgi:hypothetical protein